MSSWHGQIIYIEEECTPHHTNTPKHSLLSSPSTMAIKKYIMTMQTARVLKDNYNNEKYGYFILINMNTHDQ